jgi:hypothetical protein
MKRASDRARAMFRRTHQHGESEEHFVERITAELQRDTGYTVEIARDGELRYVVKGFRPNDPSDSRRPFIRVVRHHLLAAARQFDQDAQALAAAGVKP